MNRALAIISGKYTPELLEEHDGSITRNPSQFVHFGNFMKNAGLRRCNGEGEEQFYYKIMAVRDPFERLLSAFKDKVEYRPFGSASVSEYSFKIAQRHRNASEWAKAVTEEDKSATFDEFIKEVLMMYSTTDRHTAINTHYTPYYTICRPCQLKYDLIIKFDTYVEDMKYMFKDILKTNYSIDVLLDKDKGPHIVFERNGKTLEQYYQEVNPISLEHLREFLSYDCALFGYNPHRSFK